MKVQHILKAQNMQNYFVKAESIQTYFNPEKFESQNFLLRNHGHETMESTGTVLQ